MKILKFLHASNFQLHIPVTCWPTPISAEREVSEFKNGLGDASSPTEGPIASLSLERTESWMFGAAFPELPPSLTEECLTAPWKSAEQVFEIALEQNVDFLLLTGDVLQPDLTGPRGLVFLVNQFRRLQERGISVYWKLERSIEEWLLPNFQFPENVFLFPADETHIKKFRLADSTKNIFIVSWNSMKPDFSRYDFSKLPGEKLPPSQTIALCPNEEMFFSVTGNRPEDSCENQAEITDKNQIANRKSENFALLKNRNPFQQEIPFTSAIYVGLTGNSERTTLKYGITSATQNDGGLQTTFHSPGPTLYHSPEVWKTRQAVQPAGVSVVQMDLDGELPVSLQFFPTETISWCFLEKQIPEKIQNWENLRNWSVQELTTQFLPRSENRPPENRQKFITSTSSATRTLVYWRFKAEKSAQNKLLRILFTETFQNAGFQSQDGTPNLSSLLKNLRNAGEKLETRPWTVSVAPSREGLIPPTWSQGESMLSSFLRLAQQHLMEQSQEKSQSVMKLDDFVPHTLDLNEYLTEDQLKNGFAASGKLTREEECAFLELASVLGADSFAEMQDGGLKK